MVFKLTPLLVQQAVDAAQRCKTLVQGSTAARKPDVTYDWVWPEGSDADAEPYFVSTLVPHPKPNHPDDKYVKHVFRRFEAVYDTNKKASFGGPITGFKVSARADGPSVVHKADLVALAGAHFHISELRQMLRAADSVAYPLQSVNEPHKGGVAKQRAITAY
jgi:hypothetical protein